MPTRGSLPRFRADIPSGANWLRGNSPAGLDRRARHPRTVPETPGGTASSSGREHYHWRGFGGRLAYRRRPGPAARAARTNAVGVDAAGRWYKKGVDQLRASVSAGGSYTLVVLAGESDMNTRQLLRGVLEQAMSRPARHLVIDMSGLEFIDSATVRVLVDVQGTLAGDGGQMSFVAPHPLITRVLSLTGTDQIVPVYQDLDTALAAGG